MHRRQVDGITRRDEEETEDFDSVEHFQRLAEGQLMARMRKRLAADVGEAIAQRDEKSRRDSIRLDKKIETVFSCYYKPTLKDVPTTPESPLSPLDMLDRVAMLS